MSLIHKFKKDISKIILPTKFTFPFYYEPHELTLLAAQELQAQLEKGTLTDHNFGLRENQEGKAIGKMFGILIVRYGEGKIGYLRAFSGLLGGKALLDGFVPPVFNLFEQNSFYKRGEDQLNALTKQIKTIEKNNAYRSLQNELKAKKEAVANEQELEREKIKHNKARRKELRIEAKKNLSSTDYISYLEDLAKESISEKSKFKKKSTKLKNEVELIQENCDQFTSKILMLKKQRKEKSINLQDAVFEKYQFLNYRKERKGAKEIFPNYLIQKPPAGTGDCSAPKLLQYAFLNDLKPIALGEFWWGVPPKKEIRKHKNFYPSCHGRCKPILTHMLEGLEVQDNPFLTSNSKNKKLQIVHEDDSIIIVNKPAELLSVPGKSIYDSVYSRIKEIRPNAEQPLIIHRLDMSTSGIMILSKTKEANKFIQRQFIKRTIKKRYVAIVDGTIDQSQGLIDLPLRLDINDRPKQLVCYEHGKSAQTKWKVIETKEGTTKIHLEPLTGRTHQLRVHMAHPLGLNTPIIGDDLYGNKSRRLLLHAEHIEFIHPTSREKIEFYVKAEF